jgi:diacylglycerol kinase family enzyme
MGTAFHLDGESLQTTEELVQINILPKSLKIIV